METLSKLSVQLEINHLLAGAGAAARGSLRNDCFGLNCNVCGPVTIKELDPQTFFLERKKCQAYFPRFNFLPMS